MTEQTAPEHVDLADYSRALDEIHRLRAALAYEAGVTAAHLSYATFPKSRRAFAEEQVQRMRAAARGEANSAYTISGWRMQAALRDAGASVTLTRWEWEHAPTGRS
ncbi:hypothetical protein ACFYUR_18995 [Micromonospora haikouensis]|uniref:hypothetical protein n=1 Tax=Micromonospora haikouensis TaxID=686309 RepID=UPI0036841364